MNYQDLFDNQHNSSFRKHSEETRAKLSKITKDQMTPEARNHLSEVNKGKIILKETVTKIVATRQANGYAHSAETRAKMSAKGGWSKGIVYTGERLAKQQKTNMETLCKPIMTPKGSFNSIKEAHLAFGWHHGGPVYYRMKKFPCQWYYITK